MIHTRERFGRNISQRFSKHKGVPLDSGWVKPPVSRKKPSLLALLLWYCRRFSKVISNYMIREKQSLWYQPRCYEWLDTMQWSCRRDNHNFNHNYNHNYNHHYNYHYNYNCRGHDRSFNHNHNGTWIDACIANVCPNLNAAEPWKWWKRYQVD